jgi:4-methyl-5(b-hydroxyethyl)-thiazole monophosphate biosynthesis
MAKMIVPIATGFEEIEAISIIDICRRAGIEVIIAGVEDVAVTGANAITIVTQTSIETIDTSCIDMIVLPGGGGGTDILASNKTVQDLLKEFKHKDKYIGAICAAPYALHTAGVLNQNYTCYPGFENKIRLDGFDSSKKVVTDGKVITSRGPGTAICFALEIVKTLCGDDSYNQVKNGVLATYC